MPDNPEARPCAEYVAHRPSDGYIEEIIRHGPPQVGQIVYSLAVEVKRLRESMLAAARRTVDDRTRDQLEAALNDGRVSDGEA